MRVTRSAASLGVNAGAIGLCVAVCQAFGGGQAKADPHAAKPTPWRWATRSSTANGCPTTRAATAATGSGRSTTIRPASPATTRAAAAARGRSARTSTSSAPRVTWRHGHRPVAAGTAPRPIAGRKPRSRIARPIGALSTRSIDVHPGFRTSRTVVLHKFGIDPNYDSWRSQALTDPGRRLPSRVLVSASVEALTEPVQQINATISSSSRSIPASDRTERRSGAPGLAAR